LKGLPQRSEPQDRRRKREGKLDQVAGKVKGQAEKAVDKVKDVLTGNRPRRPAK
jgi:hypothetical protein